MKKLRAWIEAMRLRTLPVSVAGVLCAFAFAKFDGESDYVPGWLCLCFAILAQIASNFANEYYDFKGGLDKAGRVGPRRGVTEGDISAKAMKVATFMVLGLACLIGCSLIYWGGAWLMAVGAFIAIGVIAYSAGPYPLSHHGLGEMAVILFFGVIPVNFTYYLMCGCFDSQVALASLSMGLMGANVLIVNNYRDVNDDREVGKNTLCVKLGRSATANIYLANGVIAIGLMAKTWIGIGGAWMVIPAAYLAIHFALYATIRRRDGAKLNPMLGATAMTMLCYVLAFLATAITISKF